MSAASSSCGLLSLLPPAVRGVAGVLGVEERKNEHSYESELGLYVIDALNPGAYENVAVRRSKDNMRRSLNTASLFSRLTNHHVSSKVSQCGNNIGGDLPSPATMMTLLNLSHCSRNAGTHREISFAVNRTIEEV